MKYLNVIYLDERKKTSITFIQKRNEISCQPFKNRSL